MSIEKHAGKMQLVCDECGEGHTGEDGKSKIYRPDEFDIMIKDAKEDGWIIQKATDGKWEHTCFDCV